MEKKKLAGALIRNQKAFASGPFDIGKTDVLEHSIDTSDAAPVRLPLRRHGPVKEKAISGEMSWSWSGGAICKPLGYSSGGQLEARYDSSCVHGF